ncbi:MAG: prepilin-type N-terminal cleavage/methylation domain-containing protein [Planctomycetota bacterium]|nr:prepilin-type N-terminal cleavage/methylation domain-containing protein [Planctomycetota bacterium]
MTPPPTPPTRCRLAFTLIELLVVIAIIALLIGILLPTLGKARDAARSAISLSNMRSLSQLMFTYTNDHDDEWLNPFDKDTTPWNGVQLPLLPGQFWSYRNSERATEVWGTQFASLLMHYAESNNGSMFSEVQFHPGDTYALQRTRDQLSGDEGVDHFIADGSYWYPPAFWLAAERYETADLIPVTPEHLRRNRIANVPLPASKVLMFERFDFKQRQRLTLSGGSIKEHPQFNNPAASTRFVSADGSAGEVDIADLVELSTSSLPKVAREFTPSGLWDPPFNIFRHWGMSEDPFENGQRDTTAHPAWFWATRDGLKGRDLYTR